MVTKRGRVDVTSNEWHRVDKARAGTFGRVKFFRRKGYEFARKKSKPGYEHIMENEIRWHKRLGIMKTYKEVKALMIHGESLVCHGCLISFSLNTHSCLWTPRAVGPLSDKNVQMHVIDNFPSSTLALYSILDDLHQCGVSHNDLSAQNVVMTASMEFALIDLATVKECNSRPCNDCTLATQAPENMMFLPSLYVSPAHYKSDVWSMTCIIAMIVNNGLFPFAEPSWKTTDWVMSNMLPNIYRDLGVPTVKTIQNSLGEDFATIDHNVQPHILPHIANCRAIQLIESINQEGQEDREDREDQVSSVNSGITKSYMKCSALKRAEDIEVAHGIFTRGICYFSARATAAELMDYVWRKIEADRAQNELRHLMGATGEILNIIETSEKRQENKSIVGALAEFE